MARADPAADVVDLVARFARAYPGHLGPLTQHRIVAEARLAWPVRPMGDLGWLDLKRQDLNVASARLVTLGRITSAELARLLGVSASYADQMQRLGRIWIAAYERAIDAKNQSETNHGQGIPSRPRGGSRPRGAPAQQRPAPRRADQEARRS